VKTKRWEYQGGISAGRKYISTPYKNDSISKDGAKDFTRSHLMKKTPKGEKKYYCGKGVKQMSTKTWRTSPTGIAWGELRRRLCGEEGLA